MRQKPALTASDCHRMMAAAKAKAADMHWAVTIAIVDESGAPLLLERLDGATPFTARMAIAKAHTSAVMGQPSRAFEERAKDRPGFLTAPIGGALVQGAIPVIVSGECVGAVGVSGVKSPEDEQVAQAGVDGLA